MESLVLMCEVEMAPSRREIGSLGGVTALYYLMDAGSLSVLYM